MQVKKDHLTNAVIALMGHYGVGVSPELLRTTAVAEDTGKKSVVGAALRDFRRFGFVARAGQEKLSAFPQLVYPVIIFTQEGEAQLLHGVCDGYARISSALAPEQQTDIPVLELDAGYAQLCILAKPENAAKLRAPADYSGDGRHWLKAPLRANRSVYRDVIMTAMVANLLAAGIALFAMQVYDRVIPNKAYDTLWILVTGVALAAVMEFCLRLVRSRMIEVSGRDVDLQMSSSIYRHVMSIRMENQPKSAGAFIAQLREVGSVREFLTAGTISALSDVPFAIIFTALIALIGGPVVIVVLAAIALAVLPGIVFGRRLRELSQHGTREGAIYGGLMLDTINNVETIKSIGGEGGLLSRHDDLASQVAATTSRSRLLTSVIMQISGVAQQAAYIGVIIVGAYQIGSGAMTTGALVACTILSSRALSPMGQVGQLITRWQGLKSSVQSIDRIMKLPVDREDQRSYLRPDYIEGSYQLEGVTLSHEGAAAPSLRIDRLQVAAGERVALLGGIGSGKTTLLRILAGLYEPTDGKVLLGGLSLGQIDPAIRTRRIGYLPQSVGVFQGTLRENLQVGLTRHGDRELIEALRSVGLGALVDGNPRGLDLHIQSSGSLSGGQRQAIGIARLLLQDPDVVLLDEPTASLDQHTEAKVIEVLKDWLEGRTLIMATHKKEVMPLTERAVILGGGRVAQDTILGKSHRKAEN